MRKIFCVLLAIIVTIGAAAQTLVKDFSSLEDCDLLFHMPESANNITDVTAGGDKPETDHVAVFFRIEGEPVVIEAVGRGVVIRRADSLTAGGEKYVFVRVKDVDRHATIKNALKFLGRPYDHKFFADDSEIYCSELVQKSFVDRQGRKMFRTIRMSFHDATGKVTEFWKEYYSSRWNVPVPEGEEGTNPADMYVQALDMR